MQSAFGRERLNLCLIVVGLNFEKNLRNFEVVGDISLLKKPLCDV